MKIQVGNTQLNVEDHGSGSPLLLIHGFPLNLEMWRPQIESLSASSRVIALDQRGHGQSPPTPGPYPIDLLANDCAAVLESLGVQSPAVICGHSMGGYISFAFYRRFPHRVSGLILAATRAGADTDQARAKREKAVAETEMKGTQPVLDNMLPILLAPDTYQEKPELVQAVDQILSKTSAKGMLSALQGMKARPDSKETLGKIRVPTLIIHGLEDQIITMDESRTMHTEIQNSQLEIIPDAGHLPNLEQPSVFNRSVASFLSSI
jgi:pimeloyl-ACP methyl ester carboxylesterase